MLAVVGGLFDRSTVTVKTIESAYRALAAFGRPVLIVPDHHDWFDNSSPYLTVERPPSIAVADTGQLTAALDVAGVWIEASAVTSPEAVGRGPRIRLVAGELEHHVGTAVADDEVGVSGLRTQARASAVPDLAAGESELLLLEIANAAVSERRVVLEVPVPGAAAVDVTDATSTQDLEHLLEGLSGGDAPVPVRLVGQLAAGVVLPDSASLDGVSELATDELDLIFPKVDATDGSTLAEFVRGVLEDPSEALVRHQAIAVGLAALAAREDADQVEEVVA
jgi:hypothetical protein